MDLKETEFENVNWISLAQNRALWETSVNNEPQGSKRGEEFFVQMSDCQLINKDGW